MYRPTQDNVTEENDRPIRYDSALERLDISFILEINLSSEFSCNLRAWRSNAIGTVVRAISVLLYGRPQL